MIFIKDYKSYEITYKTTFIIHTKEFIMIPWLIWPEKKPREIRKPLSNMNLDKKWIFFSLAFLAYGMFS